jgi:MATE family multidrug resistance protein
LSGGRNVDAFARSTAGVAVEWRRQTSQTRISSASSRARSRPLYTTTTAASVDDADSQPIKYRWTRPTLDIAVPALIGMMADPLLSLMDTAFVGRVGAIELASLGACTSIFHLAFHAFRATTTATTSLVSSALQSSPEEAKEVTQLSLSLGIVMGFSVLIGLRATGTWCLGTMGISQTSPLFPPAHAYLNTRLWAAPPVLGIVVAEGAFRGYANTRIPLIASCVAALINLVLDPILMFPLGLGVTGAAAATALSQFGAAAVYAFFLDKKKMLPSRRKKIVRGSKKATTTTSFNRIQVIRTILGANIAMFAKQGSLLLAWAYATSKATRLGAAHVAAHQVALSFWLVFALLLDGAAVSAQVLMSKSTANLNKIRSLSKYMTKFAVAQGVASTMLISILGTFVPELFTKDVVIQRFLHQLMPHLAAQQVLISLTFVLESMAAGANQFNLLAAGTTLSTLLSVLLLKGATDVTSIWSRGIVTLFLGRFLTSVVAVMRVNRLFPWQTSTTKESNNGGNGTITN